MHYDDLRMAGRERWNALLAEAELMRRVSRLQSARGSFRPRLARGLIGMAARIDPAAAPSRRATTSF